MGPPMRNVQVSERVTELRRIPYSEVPPCLGQVESTWRLARRRTAFCVAVAVFLHFVTHDPFCHPNRMRHVCVPPPARPMQAARYCAPRHDSPQACLCTDGAADCQWW